MKYITNTTLFLVKACDENPVNTTLMIFISMLFFTILEAVIETLIFGERFEHWFDPIFIGGFIAWASYATYICAVLKIKREH